MDRDLEIEVPEEIKLPLEKMVRRAEEYPSGFKVSVRHPGEGRGRLQEEHFDSIVDARDFIFSYPADEGVTLTIYYKRPGAPALMGYKDSQEIWKIIDGRPQLWHSYRTVRK